MKMIAVSVPVIKTILACRLSFRALKRLCERHASTITSHVSIMDYGWFDAKISTPVVCEKR
ncbi:MAG: hypothetical protein R3C28_14690 [Pirellulaceae bacterium]